MREETIDLDAIYDELSAIENNITTARDRHNEFLKELGLQSLLWSQPVV